MGNAQSIRGRAGRRRANRLSKSSTNEACLSPIRTRSPPAVSQVNLPTSPRPAPWRHPQDGSSIPASPSVVDGNSHMSQLPPCTTPLIQTPPLRASWDARSDPIAEVIQGGHYHTITSSASITQPISMRPPFQESRRASYHPDSWHSSSLSSSCPRRPIRTYSLQAARQLADSTIYETEFENATSSNTYFLTNNERFSVTHRQPLLRRPGVATRRSSKQSVRRFSPPADERLVKASSNRTFEKTRSVQLPLPESEDLNVRHSFPAVFTRPETPSNLDYTHLGPFKLGTLRVVNGSTSPCPSDRSRMSCDTSEDLRATSV